MREEWTPFPTNLLFAGFLEEIPTRKIPIAALAQAVPNAKKNWAKRLKKIDCSKSFIKKNRI